VTDRPERTKWQRHFPKSAALWREPRAREDCSLGAEGWLGLMVFLGVALGLLYAHWNLP
jgi:hypothetical protein